MQHATMAELRWHKSTRSGQGADCVEVAEVGDQIKVRDSKDPDGPVLAFSAGDWLTFVASLHRVQLCYGPSAGPRRD